MAKNENRETKVDRIKVKNLNFDPRNPRFSRYFETGDQPEDEIIERMVKAENLQEIMSSIAEQGYFPGEPLLVAESEGKLFVIEGNRRLAALKMLLRLISPENSLPSIESIINEANHKPEEVECIVFDNRNKILKYLGYRHITGAKKWDSLSKARYLKQLKDEFYSEIPLDDQMRAIAKEIGSRRDYVAQMLAGLNVFEYAQKNNFFDLQRVKADDVDFGVLTTALSYANISEYIGLEGRTDLVGENINAEKTKHIFSWIFAQDQQGDTILGESRNLRKLASIVSSPVAVEKLIEEKNLELAYLHTEGPSKAFSKALGDARKMLITAYDMIPVVDSFNDEHLTHIDKCIETAEDMHGMIKRKIRQQKKAEPDD